MSMMEELKTKLERRRRQSDGDSSAPPPEQPAERLVRSIGPGGGMFKETPGRGRTEADHTPGSVWEKYSMPEFARTASPTLVEQQARHVDYKHYTALQQQLERLKDEQAARDAALEARYGRLREEYVEVEEKYHRSERAHEESLAKMVDAKERTSLQEALEETLLCVEDLTEQRSDMQGKMSRTRAELDETNRLLKQGKAEIEVYEELRAQSQGAMREKVYQQEMLLQDNRESHQRALAEHFARENSFREELQQASIAATQAHERAQAEMQERNHLSSQLGQAKSDLKESSEEGRKLQAEVEECRREAREAEKSITQTTQGMKAWREAVDVMRSELSTEQVELKEAERRMVASEVERERVSSVLGVARANLEEKGEEAARLREELQEEVQEQRRGAKRTQRLLDEAVNGVEASRQEIVGLRDRLGSSEAEQDKLLSKIEHYKSLISDGRLSIEELRLQVSSLMKSQESLQSQVQLHETAASSARTEVAEQLQRAGSLLQEKDELDEKLREHEQEVSLLRRGALEATDEYEETLLTFQLDAKKDQEGLREELQEADSARQLLQEQIRKLQDSVTTEVFERDQVALQARQELEEQLKSMQEKCDDHLIEKEKLRDEACQQEAERTRERQRLAERLKSLDERCEELAGEVMEKAEEHGSVQKALQQCQEDFAHERQQVQEELKERDVQLEQIQQERVLAQEALEQSEMACLEQRQLCQDALSQQSKLQEQWKLERQEQADKHLLQEEQLAKLRKDEEDARNALHRCELALEEERRLFQNQMQEAQGAEAQLLQHQQERVQAQSEELERKEMQLKRLRQEQEEAKETLLQCELSFEDERQLLQEQMQVELDGRARQQEQMAVMQQEKEGVDLVLKKCEAAFQEERLNFSMRLRSEQGVREKGLEEEQQECEGRIQKLVQEVTEVKTSLETCELNFSIERRGMQQEAERERGEAEEVLERCKAAFVQERLEQKEQAAEELEEERDKQIGKLAWIQEERAVELEECRETFHSEKQDFHRETEAQLMNLNSEHEKLVQEEAILRDELLACKALTERQKQQHSLHEEHQQVREEQLQQCKTNLEHLHQEWQSSEESLQSQQRAAEEERCSLEQKAEEQLREMRLSQQELLEARLSQEQELAQGSLQRCEAAFEDERRELQERARAEVVVMEERQQELLSAEEAIQRSEAAFEEERCTLQKRNEVTHQETQASDEEQDRLLQESREAREALERCKASFEEERRSWQSRDARSEMQDNEAQTVSEVQEDKENETLQQREAALSEERLELQKELHAECDLHQEHLVQLEQEHRDATQRLESSLSDARQSAQEELQECDERLKQEQGEAKEALQKCEAAFADQRRQLEVRSDAERGWLAGLLQEKTDSLQKCEASFADRRQAMQQQAKQELAQCKQERDELARQFQEEHMALEESIRQREAAFEDERQQLQQRFKQEVEKRELQQKRLVSLMEEEASARASLEACESSLAEARQGFEQRREELGQSRDVLVGRLPEQEAPSIAHTARSNLGQARSTGSSCSSASSSRCSSLSKAPCQATTPPPTPAVAASPPAVPPLPTAALPATLPATLGPEVWRRWAEVLLKKRSRMQTWQTLAGELLDRERKERLHDLTTVRCRRAAAAAAALIAVPLSPEGSSAHSRSSSGSPGALEPQSRSPGVDTAPEALSYPGHVLKAAAASRGLTPRTPRRPPSCMLTPRSESAQTPRSYAGPLSPLAVPLSPHSPSHLVEARTPRGLTPRGPAFVTPRNAPNAATMAALEAASAAAQSAVAAAAAAAQCCVGAEVPQRSLPSRLRQVMEDEAFFTPNITPAASVQPTPRGASSACGSSFREYGDSIFDGTTTQAESTVHGAESISCGATPRGSVSARSSMGGISARSNSVLNLPLRGSGGISPPQSPTAQGRSLSAPSQPSDAPGDAGDGLAPAFRKVPTRWMGVPMPAGEGSSARKLGERWQGLQRAGELQEAGSPSSPPKRLSGERNLGERPHGRGEQLSAWKTDRGEQLSAWKTDRGEQLQPAPSTATSSRLPSERGSSSSGADPSSLLSPKAPPLSLGPQQAFQDAPIAPLSARRHKPEESVVALLSARKAKEEAMQVLPSVAECDIGTEPFASARTSLLGEHNRMEPLMEQEVWTPEKHMRMPICIPKLKSMPVVASELPLHRSPRGNRPSARALDSPCTSQSSIATDGQRVWRPRRGATGPHGSLSARSMELTNGSQQAAVAGCQELTASSLAALAHTEKQRTWRDRARRSLPPQPTPSSP